jgi:O-antigen/teichoic acid export membrane protein
MTPSLAREQVTNAGRVASWTRASTRLLLLFALPTAVGGSLLASRIIEALYGRAFAEAGPVFAVLAWTVPFHLFNAFAGNVTAAVGLERPAARVFLASALLNIGLNLVFIPRYGLMAAAVVTVLTDGLAALRFISLLHQRLDLPGFWRQLGRTAAAAAGMGGVIYLAFPLPLPAVVLLGVLAYGLLAALLGLIDRSMLRAAGRLLAVARPGAG